MKLSNKLPICIRHEYILSLNYAFPLCILLSAPKYHGWFYENYFRLFTQMNRLDYFECGLSDSLDYSIGGNLESRLLRHSYISSDILIQVKDIHNVLKSNIDKRIYSVIFLDEYYLNLAPVEDKKHFAHEVLIFGYDDNENSYMAAAYQGSAFKEVRITYYDLQNAYHSAFDYISERGGWEKKMLMMFQLLDVEDSYPFSMDEFKNALAEYRDGQYTKKEEFLGLIIERNRNFPEHKVKCGSKTFEDFEEYLKINHEAIEQSSEESDLLEVFTRYSAFHMLRDHKRGLYKRLDYIVNQYSNNDPMKKLSSEYKKVWDKSEALRMIYLKAMKRKNIKNKDKLLKMSIRMKSMIREIKQMEDPILNEIIELLNKECEET